MFVCKGFMGCKSPKGPKGPKDGHEVYKDLCLELGGFSPGVCILIR